jgi:DNA polymerase IV
LSAATPPTADRTVLHVDMDAFYASVEQLRRPELRGRPVVVGGSGARGVVAAASYEARAFGVRSAMPSLQARRLCPHATFVPGDHAHYAAVSTRIMDLFRTITPLVEPLSLDEAFLDVTGARRLHGDGPTIAALVREQVLEQEGLTCSVGVARNKFLAKLATEQAKPGASVEGPRPGTGVTVVRAGDELAFLRPLPVSQLWGVGPKTLEKLRRIGVRTVHDVEKLPPEVLVRALGEARGRHLHLLAHAVDDRPVTPDLRPKSIGHEETFAADLHDHDEIHVHLVRLSDAVAGRVRAHGQPGRTVTVKVRFGDFTTLTRSVTLAQPIESGPAVLRAARRLLREVDVEAGVRLLGVTVSNLAVPAGSEVAPEQLSLWGFAGSPGDGAGSWTSSSRESVTGAVDAVRARFGADALVPATLAGGSRRTFRPGERQWGPNRPAEGGVVDGGRVVGLNDLCDDEPTDRTVPGRDSGEKG